MKFVATKRGLAIALHSGDPAFQALPAYFQDHLGPALQALLDAAVDAGAIRAGVDPLDLLSAVAKLCIPPVGTDDISRASRMVSLLIDGLRYGASPDPARATVRNTPSVFDRIRLPTRQGRSDGGAPSPAGDRAP